MTIVYAIAVLGVLAIVFGLILAVAAKVFEVEVDPRLPEIQACLAGANCGGCGYPGCGGCAEAILAGKAPVTACAPAGPENAAKIAEWNVKQKIAADEALATPNMLASLDAMATARGMDRAGLLAVFTAKAVVLEEIVLHIAALEDVRKAEIAALADSDPAIEAAVTQIVADASDDAEAAYAAANAQINGGS